MSVIIDLAVPATVNGVSQPVLTDGETILDSANKKLIIGRGGANYTYAGEGTGAINDLTLATNDFLQWNGTAWVNKTPANVLTAISTPSPLVFQSSSDFGNTSTNYGTFPASALSATEIAGFYTVPYAGVISAMYIRCVSSTMSQNWTVTLRVNGADSALVTTITTSATTGSDLAHTVTVAASDYLSLKFVSAGGTGSAVKPNIAFKLIAS